MQQPVRNGLKTLLRHSLVAALSALMVTPAMADDLDVYSSMIAGQQKPNILFVLDYSGSMNDPVPDSGGLARIEVLRNAMADVMNNNFDKINAGLGSLFEWETTGIKWPVSELNADANITDPAIPVGTVTGRDVIVSQLLKDADGATATVDALVEAAQYFRGGRVTHDDADVRASYRHQPATWDADLGEYTGGNENAAIAATYYPKDAWSATGGSGSFAYCYNRAYDGGTGVDDCAGRVTSDCKVYAEQATGDAGVVIPKHQRCRYRLDSAWTQPNYISPITNSCQANAIVLISDGEPTSLTDGPSLASVVGPRGASGCKDLTSMFTHTAETTDEGNCGPEIVAELANKNQIDHIPDSTVRTYTVGFGIAGDGQNYLDLLAEQGRGRSFSATNPAELTAAINDIVDDIVGGSESFAAMSVNVDRDAFAHDNRAFYSLFKPSHRGAWQGNLKGYFIDKEGLLDIHGNKATELRDGRVSFKESTQSFWSATPDGNKVEAGGASETTRAGGRKLYTYVTDEHGNATIPANGVDLNSNPRYRLSSANSAITNTHLGANVSTAERALVLDWLQTAPLGDALHSRVVPVKYAGGKSVVFTMTNQGLIHAIDATDPSKADGNTAGGEELFAFMPRRLLANLPALYRAKSGGRHIYGLDGQITPWHEDTNGNGIVDGDDTLLLVFGMRRGGNAYYALDVTDPKDPRLEWMIEGSSNPADEFHHLAQSWSRMSLITVRKNGHPTRVLAFAGGYDAAKVDNTDGNVDGKGGAIYMIDRDGNVEWQKSRATEAVMAHSIPSDLTPIDSNDDGMTDRFYVGDTSGQLLRVDFDDISDRGTGARLTVLADFPGESFYYPPSVSLETGGGERFLAIGIGSGNRSKPMDKTLTNHIYMVRDTYIDKPLPDSFRTLTRKDLYDASANEMMSTDVATATRARTALGDADGWYIDLAPGEKSLSKVVTFEGKIMATTFEPNADSTAGICEANNVNRLYIMDVVDATPVRYDIRGVVDDSFVSAGDRFRTINAGPGISSEPIINMPKGSSTVQIMVDKDSVSFLNQRLARVYWHAR